MTIDKEDVLSRLTPDLVAAQYGIVGRWQGRWLRARRCGLVDHTAAAFGLSREGTWHCWSCDEGGGDLLSLVAWAEGLDCKTEFPAVIEVAAQIAGVEADDFGAPARKPRATRPVVELAPFRERLEIATGRAAWIWARMDGDVARIDRAIAWRNITLTRKTRDDVKLLGGYDWTHALAKAKDERLARSLKAIYASQPGYAIVVRSIESGAPVDVRARRFEPREGEPKILGMPGGLTIDSRTDGASDLVGCYGMPHALQADLVIVAEGWCDYLTAAWRWPHADALGAVDAGQYPLVAAYAARYLAERGQGKLVLVVQDDGEGKPDPRDETKVIPPAAARAADLASKRAIGLLGPHAVSWIDCRAYGATPGKKWDLNDIVRTGRANQLPEEP